MTQTVVKSPPREPPGAQQDVDWPLLSTQGRVLLYIAFCPGCTVDEIARAMGLTGRAVWGTVRSLRRSGMVSVTKHGRKNSFSINLDAPLIVPSITGYNLRDMLGALMAERAGRRSNECLNEPA